MLNCRTGNRTGGSNPPFTATTEKSSQATLEGFFCTRTDRCKQSLQKGWTEYKKTKSARRRSLSFFHIVARAPPARRVGNAGRLNPQNGGAAPPPHTRKSFAHQNITLRPTEHLYCAIPLVAIHVRAPNPKHKLPEPTPPAPSILARYPPGAPQCHWFECLGLQRSQGNAERLNPTKWRCGSTPPHTRKSFAHQNITLRPTEHLYCAIPLVAIHVRAPKPKLTHPEPTPAAPSILAKKKNV